MASQARQNEDDSFAKLNTSTLRVPSASMMPVRPKVSYYISLSDWANPTLQISSNLASLTSDNSKAYITSEIDSWSGSAPMAFRRAAAFPAGSHPYANTNNCFYESPLVCGMMNQEKKLRAVNSLPTPPLRHHHMLLPVAYCPSTFDLAFHELELPSERVLNSHADSVYDNNMMQHGHIIDNIRESNISIPNNPATLVDLSTVMSEIPKGIALPDCCSPSRKSGRQVCMPDNKVSESGWTRYLDQLTGFKACPSSLELSADSRVRSQFNRYTQKRAKANFEDPSMTSDASSGPEHPLLYEDTKELNSEGFKKNGCGAEVPSGLGNDACTSKISCRSISGGLLATGWGMSKRRKIDLEANVSPATHAILSRKEVLKVPEEEIDTYSFEVSVDDLNTEHKTKTSENDEGGIVNDRLEALQQLIPNSETLDREEMLALAIDYVKSLESKIKMFEAAKMQIVDRAEIGATKNFPFSG